MVYFRSVDISASSVVHDGVVVVGAGAAGISLCLELMKLNTPTLLLESGDFEVSKSASELNKGEVSGFSYPPLDVTRVRCFGGSTQHWGGWCEPLEASDFTGRGDIPSWPIGERELNEYFTPAFELLQIDHTMCDNSVVKRSLGLDALKIDRSQIDTKILSVCPMPHLGRLYRTEFGQSSSVRVLLGATVTKLVANDGASANIDVIEVALEDGRRVEIRPKIIVLSMGGIEIPRLMLNSQEHLAHRMGASFELVGKFFTEHLHGAMGAFVPRDNLDLRVFEEHPHETGAFGTGCLIGALKTSRIVEDRLGGVGFKTFIETQPSGKSVLFGVWEQIPRTQSRITISNQYDRLGCRLPDLHWHVDDKDLANGLSCVRYVAESLSDAGLGMVEIHFKNAEEVRAGIEIVGGNHHLCTTRMAVSPSDGVVDPDCRAFGVPNLYIAGGSVFSSVGSAPPTLTIIALALRLANKLREAL